MPDREKVIDDLEEQIAWIRDNDFHKFPGWGHSVLAMRDALEMLKAQEPVEPVFDAGDGKTIGQFLCGKCHAKIGFGHPHFCWYCGREVKWE